MWDLVGEGEKSQPWSGERILRETGPDRLKQSRRGVGGDSPTLSPGEATHQDTRDVGWSMATLGLAGTQHVWVHGC